MCEDFFITLPNDLYNNMKLTNDELVVYALIQKNINKAKKISLISIQIIMSFMYVYNRNPRLCKAIKTALVGLLEKGYIIDVLNLHYKSMVLSEVNNTDLFYCLLEPITDNYFYVYERDLDTIFQYLNTTNIDKFSFIRYFIAIQRVTHCYEKFGWLTQKSVEKLVGEEHTIARYNNILQNELNLIIYNNNYSTSKKKYCSTYFGRVGYEENFNKLLMQKVIEGKLIYTDKANSNKKRSIKKKISNLEKNTDKSKDEKIKELEELIKQYEQCNETKRKPDTTKDNKIDLTVEEIQRLVDEEIGEEYKKKYCSYDELDYLELINF